VATAAQLAAHIADQTLHLTSAQNSLIDAITVTAADINSIPTLASNQSTSSTDLATHIADTTVHLSSAQNTFLDALNLPTLTAAAVNFVAGTTSNIQTQLNAITTVDAQQTSDISALQTTTSTTNTTLTAHINNTSTSPGIHLTTAEKTLIDGITVPATDINKLNGIGTFLGATTLSAYLTSQNTLKLNVDGTNAMTAALNLGGFKAMNAADPTLSSDLATKGYVDNFVQGLHWVGSVKAASTTNLTLSGLQTVDGVSLAQGDRVLVKDQTSAAQNGIWQVSSGAWSRPSDASNAIELNNSAVFVLAGGTTQAKTTWVQLNTITTVGTDAIVYTAFSGPVINSAGPGITLGVGGQVSVNYGAGLTTSSNVLIANIFIVAFLARDVRRPATQLESDHSAKI